MTKTIVITGATGFVGKKLCLELFLKGYQLKILTRSKEKAAKIIPLPAEFIEWNGRGPLASEIFEGASGVIHLAGESVAGGRWTSKRKEEILKSRTETTRLLCEAINGCKEPPSVLVGASAIGIYGDRKNEVLTEESMHGNDFLARVCVAWEDSYQSFKGRLVLLRTGVVLGDGGALEKMLLPFRLGGGGKLSSGEQWMSWIHLDDLVKLYLYSLENSAVTGSVNAVAPFPIKNSVFTKILAETLGVPALFPVPGIALKILFGEMSVILIGSQKVLAEKALRLGFSYNYPELPEALASLVKPGGRQGFHLFSAYQWVPENKQKVFAFFSQAENLEVITPPWLNFHILKKSHPEIQEGTLIDYKLKIKGVPAKWRTRISQWKPETEFTDTQEKGPYSTWEHTHRFQEINGGTLMQDEVLYKIPLGPIGHVMNEILIKSDVQKIFGYRNSQVKKLFN